MRLLMPGLLRGQEMFYERLESGAERAGGWGLAGEWAWVSWGAAD